MDCLGRSLCDGVYPRLNIRETALLSQVGGKAVEDYKTLCAGSRSIQGGFDRQEPMSALLKQRPVLQGPVVS